MAREKYRRRGTKGGGRSELPRDPGKRGIPGFLGREKVKTVQGRVGYTQGETKFGPGGKGRKISLPSGT